MVSRVMYSVNILVCLLLTEYSFGHDYCADSGLPTGQLFREYPNQQMDSGDAVGYIGKDTLNECFTACLAIETCFGVDWYSETSTLGTNTQCWLQMGELGDKNLKANDLVNHYRRLTCQHTDDTTDCTDDHEHCAYWARTGQCEARADYMLSMCRISCNACCADENENCPYWAQNGQCQRSAGGYMGSYCRRSCNSCCNDEGEHCEYWAQTGQCEARADYMMVHCRRSCNTCLGGAVRTDNGCTDDNQHCTYWARTGQCQARADYMLVYCRRSCNVCN